MLAPADRSENGRQRSVVEAERFTDAYSQLEAFRHQIDRRDEFVGSRFYWNAVFFDQYAFLMRSTVRLDVIKAYDLDTGAVRFVNLNLKSFRQTCNLL